MCGISGIYQLDGSRVDPLTLMRMAEFQNHRGPDDQGLRLFSLQNRVSQSIDQKTSLSDIRYEGGIGFNRLSILDLSIAGHQPMCSNDGMVFIAFNGEVYNAFDFVAELKAAGFAFRSRTDTEVILYLYLHYGLEGMLDRLNGMFAIAIVDMHRGELILVRDRLGIKPLYWWTDNKVLLFGSEIKVFLAHPAFRASLDSEMADEFFMFRYCAGSRSLFHGVRQVEPGQWLRLRGDQFRSGFYWRLPDPGENENESFSSAVDEIDRRLSHSVTSQLLSDVKVGCQLSGGVDSSLVSYLAARASKGSIDGFSIIFQDPKYSEEKWIDQAADEAGIACYKSHLSAEAFYNSLQAATWHLDCPLNHPNSLGIFLLAEQARSQITVFLSGEGADELFGGYTRFLYAALRPRCSPYTPLLKWLPRIGPKLNARFGGTDDPTKWFILQSAFIAPDLLQLLKPDSRPQDAIERRRAIFEDGNGDHLSRCLKYELKTYLVDLLVRQDKMTMAHSMENRVPYLDHQLVEFVRQLPTRFLVGQSLLTTSPRMKNTKVALKHVAMRYFPHNFVYRNKVGFAIPLRAFFSGTGFRQLMEDSLLPGMKQRGVIQSEVVDGWWRNLSQLDDSSIEALWVCASFELWAQKFLDQSYNESLPYSSPVALVD